MARTSKKGLLSSSRPTHRTSKYRGVTRHRLTGRFEAHLWDKGCWNVNLGKKGKQVYLGAYDQEKEAAKAHDLAALKYWGISATILNFPLASYKKDLEEMMGLTREEYLASLRRKSSGFSRGVSKYRGVARHHQNGRWEARIGRVMGNKYLYLGTFDTQEEAAAAYDRAAILHRGLSAVTNFDISLYTSEIKQAKESVKPPSPQPHPVLDESINNNTKSASNSMSNECTDVNNANDDESCVHSSQDLGMLVDCTTFINFSSIEGMEALFNFSSHEEHGSSSSCIALEPLSSCIAIEPSSPLPSFHEVEGIDGEDSFLVANQTNTII